ncbi:transcriptional regulator [Sphaerisporangium krabiense]|uniref:Transcriptional regulator with XRE-family HTH domain n=1 Tax=Sphaerisporangium krabiense TaxID=763782 RepID=A0A7W8Z018_9ACTN|nr:helix-turn-helix transcriptional regulator [Sphaerisporangium krabiense]MBB5624974.1 transcriptional regulator with XRE-family HTH domain [Sphaerisporangium krabiense]GII66986.1 transcriptional regulator [Sphaerisporangium krabiense]
MADKYTPQAIWGRELRHYRQVAGFTQAQLAQKIHFSESLISGIETGQLPASLEFAKSCDTTLSTGGALYRLLDWRRAQPFAQWFGEWRVKEQAASSFRAYEPLLIPGLLQTEAYARAVLRGDEIALAARMERQELLARSDPPPPMLRCVIDEAVLHRPIGSKEDMREQLDRLVSLVNPRLSIQIVPHGMHSGLTSGFIIATLSDGADVAYVDTALRGLIVSDQEEVNQAVQKFEAIRTEALPLCMSLDLITRTAGERWT